uniref:C2H2-type domain-containing protein n=1 Tax=Sinocyclocheilus rhinocerous TaxID=307959 RepID=A0A673HL07_9TELE
MINNQSIIVTIENGILTLATPPEGYAYKEDGMMSLKEHLGMKDNEDFVLLNYDGGSKSIGKISNVTSSLQDEPKARFAGSDSELTLADDCSLSEMGVTLDSYSSIKQEEGTVCAVEDDSSICQNSKSKSITCEEQQPINVLTLSGLTKKGSVVKYRCPQPGCSSTFDTRQNLKIHLVLHTEDQRPFKCTVEGCDWSFTTSYKLKRHLQSHDKVRPYKCEWENCGRRFTTVYNLKAHVKWCFCASSGCEKTFITFSALFSHNRTHFREMAQFTCTYPGCDKRYDKVKDRLFVILIPAVGPSQACPNYSGTNGKKQRFDPLIPTHACAFTVYPITPFLQVFCSYYE